MLRLCGNSLLYAGHPLAKGHQRLPLHLLSRREPPLRYHVRGHQIGHSHAGVLDGWLSRPANPVDGLPGILFRELPSFPWGPSVTFERVFRS